MTGDAGVSPAVIIGDAIRGRDAHVPSGKTPS